MPEPLSREPVTAPSDQDALFGTLPVLVSERQWGFWDFTWVNVGLAIATWAFLLGGMTARFVGAEHGIVAIVIGNVVGVAIMAISVCVASGKYGIEQYTLLRSVFGRNGVRILVVLFLAVYGVGWASVLSIMFGRATTNVVNQLFGRQFDENGLLMSALGLIAIVISWLVLWRGPVSINWLNRTVAPGLVLMSIGMVWLVFDQKSWQEIRAVQPLDPFGDDRLDFMMAVEINLAAGFGWWPVVGSLARLTRTPRAALWPNMIGVFAAAALGEIGGLLAAIALGAVDPTEWMIPLGGVILGVLALVFIALANVTSIVGMFYGMCLAMRQAGLNTVRWGVLTAVLFGPVVVAVFFPLTIYENFFIFLVWTALGFAPLSGVAAADFFILRRRRIFARALYLRGHSSPYEFWGGFNLVALISVAMGAGVYYLLLDPQSLDHSPLFSVMSASVPSCVAGAVAHVVLTKLLVERAGKGDYGYAQRVHSDVKTTV